MKNLNGADLIIADNSINVKIEMAFREILWVMDWHNPETSRKLLGQYGQFYHCKPSRHAHSLDKNLVVISKYLQVLCFLFFSYFVSLLTTKVIKGSKDRTNEIKKLNGEKQYCDVDHQVVPMIVSYWSIF